MKKTIKILKYPVLVLLALTFICSVLLLARACGIFLLDSCSKIREQSIIEKDGLKFIKRNSETEPYYSVFEIAESARNEKYIYVPDEIDRIPVKAISDYGFYFDNAYFESLVLERIYFPWSITYSCGENLVINDGDDELYVFSTSVDLIVYAYFVNTTVVPLTTYNNDKLTERCKDYLLPANIAYMFNYEDNPNEGYFFIDLVKESGTLMKPPYAPRREGYQFAGWYKDAECTEVWDFETEKIKINFDEEGNRIYEEIKLYAKWVEG